MAYSDFTMTELSKKFGLKEKKAHLFSLQAITPLPPSESLVRDLEEAALLPILSEKAKSENMIAPILREVWRKSDRQFHFYSGYSFNISEEDKLVGVCDYLFSTEQSIEIRSIVFCVVEAKNRAIEEGIPQAFAEMYAAQIFNLRNDKPTPIIYGCVTNGYDWLFLKLDHQDAYIDLQRYYSGTNELPILLSILKQIADFYMKKD
ncbi:hypothetical protein [Thermoflexibacter ruber]|uniref:Type I restriction enzyme R protein N terminus (HSDR_N) n=1 Tax=Thermoflexibacter ruber TaxID=1003 RepID=A0A1I2D730_9BACT|nr:hypothetical protein [Thermoflexibacter ruber]SFE76319.1 hypothetical protein SAMN04488541_100695 [Thermoflexibacter ruber]